MTMEGSRCSVARWLFRFGAGLGVIALSTLGGSASPAAAAPGLGRPGYSLVEVSAAVSASGISQLAFRPTDAAHLYAARTSGVVTRYDYDAVTGHLANALDVAVAP